MQLPTYSDTLEVQHLSRIFDNTGECYKFFWFQAIVSKVLEGKDCVTYEELVDEMIADAWYMVIEYHLNLGPRDTLENLVLYLQQISQLKSSEKKISTYDKNAEEFCCVTKDADMNFCRDKFLHLLEWKNNIGIKESDRFKTHILDAGCGSGRDTKAFLDAGY